MGADVIDPEAAAANLAARRHRKAQAEAHAEAQGDIEKHLQHRRTGF